jgi:hypothetical protein
MKRKKLTPEKLREAELKAATEKSLFLKSIPERLIFILPDMIRHGMEYTFQKKDGRVSFNYKMLHFNDNGWPKDSRDNSWEFAGGVEGKFLSDLEPYELDCLEESVGYCDGMSNFRRENELKRIAALSKLNDEEKKLLGLK